MVMFRKLGNHDCQEMSWNVSLTTAGRCKVHPEKSWREELDFATKDRGLQDDDWRGVVI